MVPIRGFGELSRRGQGKIVKIVASRVQEGNVVHQIN